MVQAELPELNPVLGQRSELIFSANFDAVDARPPESKLGKYEIINGALRIEERGADRHQAAAPLYQTSKATCIKPLTNFIMQADFRWDGAKDFQFGFNRLGELARKAVDGKHWEVAPHCLTIAFRQPADATKPHEWSVDDNSVEPFLNLGRCELILEPGLWYKILIEVKGDEVSAQLSNGQIIRGKAKNPSDAKVAPILRCQSEHGKGVIFDNITVWTMK